MTTDTAILPRCGERNVSVDRCRGLLVFCMISFGLFRKFGNFGFLSVLGKHEEKGLQLLPGYSLADVGEPLFLLMVALCFLPSFAHRTERDGGKKTAWHFLTRDLILIALGCSMRLVDQIMRGKHLALMIPGSVVLVAGITACAVGFFLRKAKPRTSAHWLTAGAVLLCLTGVFNLAVSLGNAVYIFSTGSQYVKLWDVLQSIGGASLLLLLFAKSPAWIRGTAGVFLTVDYSVLHQVPGNMVLLDKDTMGGFFAIAAWGGMLLIFSVMAELYYRDRAARAAGKRAFSYWIATGVLCLAAIPGVLLFPMCKGSVSPAYVAFSLPLSCLLFGIVSLTERWQPKCALLSLWGKNPLVLYLLQYIFTDAAFLIMKEGAVPLYIGIPYVLFVLCLFTYIAMRLAKRPRGVAL